MKTIESPRQRRARRHGHARSGLAVVVVVLVAALGSLGIGSCRRSQPAPPVARLYLGAIEIQDVSGADARRMGALDVSAIAGAVRNVLLASHLVEAAAPDGGGAGTMASVRASGRVGFEFTEAGDKGVVRAGVSLRLATRPSEIAGAINEELSGAGEQKYDVKPGLDRRRLGQQLVQRTAADLIGSFTARAHLAVATPAEIHAAIAADAGSLRQEAIRVAGARGLRDEVPTLLKLLQDDDEAQRDAALGALIALRERRAVTELTRNRSLRDRREMRKILEAIAILGGDEARDYLAFVADSHDDPEIRSLAAEAKSRLERRQDAGSR